MQISIPPAFQYLSAEGVRALVAQFERMETLSDNQRSFHAQLCQLQKQRGHQVH